MKDKRLKLILDKYWKCKTQYKKAEEVYRDVRFYTHGISSQLCAKTIKLTNKALFLIHLFF